MAKKATSTASQFPTGYNLADPAVLTALAVNTAISAHDLVMGIFTPGEVQYLLEQYVAANNAAETLLRVAKVPVAELGDEVYIEATIAEVMARRNPNYRSKSSVLIDGEIVPFVLAGTVQEEWGWVDVFHPGQALDGTKVPGTNFDMSPLLGNPPEKYWVLAQLVKTNQVSLSNPLYFKGVLQQLASDTGYQEILDLYPNIKSQLNALKRAVANGAEAFPSLKMKLGGTPYPKDDPEPVQAASNGHVPGAPLDDVALCELMVGRMSSHEVGNLCFALRVDADDLDKSTKGAMVRGLIQYMRRRGQGEVDRLKITLARQRPDMLS